MAKTEQLILTLPCNLIETMRTMAPPCGQNEFITKAIEYFVEMKRQELRTELIAGHKAMAAESLSRTKEWEATENEDWLKHVPPYEG